MANFTAKDVQELRRTTGAGMMDCKKALAASGGEDYALLVTVNAQDFARIAQGFEKRFKRPLHPIGEITSRRAKLRYFSRGRLTPLHSKGFEHFRSS